MVMGWANAQNDIESTKATVSKNKIEGHIYFLASDELRGRQTGSPEIDIAAAYLANSMRQYGVEPANKGSYYQELGLQHMSVPDKITWVLEGTELSLAPVMFRGYNIDYKGEAVFLNYGWEKDYKGKDVAGKLVVVKAGVKGENDPEASFGNRRKKRRIAEAHGAIGLVELSDFSNELWKETLQDRNVPKYGLTDKKGKKEAVHLWVQDVDGAIAKQLKASKKGKVSSSLSIYGITPTDVSAKNVVGVVQGTDPKLKDEYVVYSAHYDHEGVGKPNAENDSIYNGARDNAVGTVTVLSAAENIAKYPTKRSALFILFTAEEVGLLGSKWFVEHPVIPLDKMVYCFNSDNGGYNDTSKATIVGLDRTTVGHHIKRAAAEFGLEAISDPAPEQNLFDRSDNVSFARKGVPAPTFSLGFTAFDEEIFKYYHQVEDNPDNLDYDYLFKFFSSYVLACRLIANDPTKPFWVKGDKYFEVGKKIYKE